MFLVFFFCFVFTENTQRQYIIVYSSEKLDLLTERFFEECLNYFPWFRKLLLLSFLKAIFIKINFTYVDLKKVEMKSRTWSFTKYRKNARQAAKYQLHVKTRAIFWA